MTPKLINGFWWIDYRDGRGEHHTVGPFETNAKAWRWIDRESGQVISPAEKRSDFAFAQMAKGRGL